MEHLTIGSKRTLTSRSTPYIIVGYTTKCFDSFLALLMDKIVIQQEIAVQNNKLTRFNDTYGNLL